MKTPSRQHSDDEWLNYYATVYRINYQTLKEIQVNAWSHPTVVPEQLLSDMAFAWEQMIILIPESHSLNTLRLVYG